MSLLALNNSMRFCVFQPRLAAVEDVTHVFTQAAEIEPEKDYLSPLGVEISKDLLQIPYVRHVELAASDLYDELEVTRSPSAVSARERAEVARRVQGIIESRLGKPLFLSSQSYHRRYRC